MSGLLQIAEKSNANIFQCRSRRILNLASNITYNLYGMFCLAMTSLPLFAICSNSAIKKKFNQPLGVARVHAATMLEYTA